MQASAIRRCRCLVGWMTSQHWTRRWKGRRRFVATCSGAPVKIGAHRFAGTTTLGYSCPPATSRFTLGRCTSFWLPMCGLRRFPRPSTVLFKSLRMSRVTRPKIFENLRTCHGSPRGSSKMQNHSRNRRKMAPKNPFSASAARTGMYPCSNLRALTKCQF
jgi:hypothetical protein